MKRLLLGLLLLAAPAQAQPAQAQPALDPAPLRISLDGKGETWRDLTIYALQDYNDQRLFLVGPQDGTWPPEKGQVLLERASMPYLLYGTFSS